MKPGDWKCKCGYENFASRTHCKNCSGPKAHPGDWVCSACRFNNFAGRTHCKNCSRGGLAKKIETATVQEKPSDWYCNTCAKLNFGNRTACYGCGLPRGDHDADTKDDITCQICIGRRKDTVLPCGHAFCATCILTQQACPMCRVPFSRDQIKRLYI